MWEFSERRTIHEEGKREDFKRSRLELLHKMRNFSNEPEHKGLLNDDQGYGYYKKTKGYFAKVRFILEELFQEGLLTPKPVFRDFTAFTEGGQPRGKDIDDKALKLADEVVDEIMTQLESAQETADQ